jgi:hypothetical protein
MLCRVQREQRRLRGVQERALPFEGGGGEVHREEGVVEGLLLDHAVVPQAVGGGRGAGAGLIHRAPAIGQGGDGGVGALGDDGDFREDDVGRERAMQPPVGLEFGVGVGEGDGEALGLLPFAFAGVVGGGAVPLDALDPALLLLVVGLGPLPGREVGLGLREFLAP